MTPKPNPTGNKQSKQPRPHSYLRAFDCSHYDHCLRYCMSFKRCCGGWHWWACDYCQILTPTPATWINPAYIHDHVLPELQPFMDQYIESHILPLS